MKRPLDEDRFDFEIEALSDEALELFVGGKSSEGPKCCSCSSCSGSVPRPRPPKSAEDSPRARRLDT